MLKTETAGLSTEYARRKEMEGDASLDPRDCSCLIPITAAATQQLLFC